MRTYGPDVPYFPADDRYETMPFRRVGDSGLKLPVISLGLWHNFGDDKPLATQRATLRRAFDLGVTHFDLANNYGPPAGRAETNFGRHLKDDFRPFRDELVISTKAGYGMWPGPYGEWGSRKYLLSSLDQSLERMGLELVHDLPVDGQRAGDPRLVTTHSASPSASARSNGRRGRTRW